LVVLTSDDLRRLDLGTHWFAYDVLGAHVHTYETGEACTSFALWAPHAQAVSVVGDFKGWHNQEIALERIARSDYWSVIVPCNLDSTAYKYKIQTKNNKFLLKLDPMAQQGCATVREGSVVTTNNRFNWTDALWMQRRDCFSKPLSIYEVDLNSWKVNPGRRFSYKDHGAELIHYALQMGFSHIQCMPLTEYPYGGSWGYQVTGMFCPTSRYGTPDELRAFINLAHNNGLGIILDWVPAHFANDAFALERFDGQPLYEPDLPLNEVLTIWGTYPYDFQIKRSLIF